VHPTWQLFLNARSNDAPAPADGSLQDSCTALVDLAVLRLHGTDAASFMQGYFTADLDDLNDTRALFGAYCDIKGRAVADLIILGNQDGLLLITQRSLVEPIRESLQKYLMFSKSELSDISEQWLTLGLLGGNATGSDLATLAWTVECADGHWQVAVPGGRRWLCLARVDEAERIWSMFEGHSHGVASWRLADIKAGIAHLEAATSASFLPQMLGYDELDGISFTKGCYLGQEVVARAQSRGRVKRRLSRWRWADQPDDGAPAAGADLASGDGRRVGTVIQSAATSSSSGELLAVVAEAARDQPLHVASLALSPVGPAP
jgi:folate-binding protein YgfZ